MKKKIPKRCWGCLGDSNDEFDELVECDSCGVTVHESKFKKMDLKIMMVDHRNAFESFYVSASVSECYGMSDSDSLASVDSSNPDLPWFCDACRAGVTDPVCELCPNSGMMFYMQQFLIMYK